MENGDGANGCAAKNVAINQEENIDNSDIVKCNIAAEELKDLIKSNGENLDNNHMEYKGMDMNGGAADEVFEGNNGTSDSTEPAGAEENGTNGQEESNGYKVEERKETENISHNEEMVELPGRTEFHSRDVKEVRMEEVSSREVVRLATEDEIRALVDAAFSGEGEVEIGREVSVEEFTRVEVIRAEGGDEGVPHMTTSVTEEHKYETSVENNLEVKEEGGEGKVAEGGEGKMAEGGEGDKIETSAKDGDAIETIANDNEVIETEQDVNATVILNESENVPAEGKGQGLLDLIKSKTRSLSRDRKQNKEAMKEEEIKEEGKNKKSKDKTKRWSLFGKSGTKETEKTSSDESAGEEPAKKKEQEQEVKQDTEKLNNEDNAAEVKNTAEGTNEIAPSNDEETGKNEKKEKSHKKLKLGLFGKHTEKKHSRSPSKGAKEINAEMEKENVEPVNKTENEEQTNGEDAKQGENTQTNSEIPTKENEQKTKEHKWFHFNRKNEKESHDGEKEKEKKWSLFGKKTHKDEIIPTTEENVDTEDKKESTEVVDDEKIEEDKIAEVPPNVVENDAPTEERKVDPESGELENSGAMKQEESSCDLADKCIKEVLAAGALAETMEAPDVGPSESGNWSVSVNVGEQTRDLIDDLTTVVSVPSSDCVAAAEDLPVETGSGDVGEEVKQEVETTNVQQEVELTNDGSAEVSEQNVTNDESAVVENSEQKVTDESLVENTGDVVSEKNENTDKNTKTEEAVTKESSSNKKFHFGLVFGKKGKKSETNQSTPSPSSEDKKLTNGDNETKSVEEAAEVETEKTEEKSAKPAAEKKKKFHFDMKFRGNKKQQKSEGTNETVDEANVSPGDEKVVVDVGSSTEVKIAENGDADHVETITKENEIVADAELLVVEEKEEEKSAEPVAQTEVKEDAKKPKSIHKMFTFGKKTKTYNVQGKEAEVSGKVVVAEAVKLTSDEPVVEVATVSEKSSEKTHVHKGFSFNLFGKKKHTPEVSEKGVASNETADIVTETMEGDAVDHTMTEVKEGSVEEMVKTIVTEAADSAVVEPQECSATLNESEIINESLPEVFIETSPEVVVVATTKTVVDSQVDILKVPVMEVTDDDKPAISAASENMNGCEDKIVEEKPEEVTVNSTEAEITVEGLSESVVVVENAVQLESSVVVTPDIVVNDAEHVTSLGDAAEAGHKVTFQEPLQTESNTTDTLKSNEELSTKEQKSKRFSFNKLRFGKKHDKVVAQENGDTAVTQEEVVDKETEVEKNTGEEVNKNPEEELKNPEQEDNQKENNETEIAELPTNEQNENKPTEHVTHHHKWHVFGKKADKKKETEKKDDKRKETSTENKENHIETTTIEIADVVNEADQKDQKKSMTKKSHSIGKGLFGKFFSPKHHKSERIETVANENTIEVPVLSYAVHDEGEIIAETHYVKKPKQDETDGLKNGENFEEMVQRTVSALEGTDRGSSGEFFVVVAIDFGTTFSGYAFSFTQSPESIHMMRKWEGGDPGVINQKTPTILLLNPQGEFHSFGFTARDFYHDLGETEASNWMYFDKFKMALHSNAEDLSRNTTVTACNGKPYPALDLFTHALRFFKDHALKELTNQSNMTITNEDIRWVITVPAIWKESAKLFMREAAYKAGIAVPEHRDRLLIALEPEAASIYIRRLRRSQLVPERPAMRPLSPQKNAQNGMPETVASLDYIADDIKPGTRYMVVDCGGGTVDITVHEMDEGSGNLKELYKASGGPYGSMQVDKEFEKLMCDIFGTDFIESFKLKRSAGWIDLMIAFESRKRAATTFRQDALNVSLPFSFIDYHKKIFGTQIEASLKKCSNKNVRWSMQGMLRLMPEAMLALFQPTIINIKNVIQQVITNPDIGGIEYLFLVGGFAESPIIQSAVRSEFKDKLKIIIPQDVGLTILKGAVCFGLDPSVVASRKSRHTYGVGIVNQFDPATHDPERLVTRDRVNWCTGVFDTFVSAGSTVNIGDTITRRYTPAKQDQVTSIIHIYSSDDPSVRYVTDEGVKRCGTLRLDLTDMPPAEDGGKQRREIQTQMTFGGTEISVTALDVTTGHNVKDIFIDFLSK